MEEFNKKTYFTLKEAAKLFGYSPDYLGFLIRKRKIKGKRTYSTRWQITKKELLTYCKERKKKIKKPHLFNKKLTLKQASRISGYSHDYIGQLLRTGKLKGKRIKTQVSWLVEKQKIENYRDGREERQSNTRKPLRFSFIKVRRKKLILIGRRLFASTFVLIYFLSGIAPTDFLLASIGAFFIGEPETINLYSQASEGDWQNPQNSQGPPDLSPDKDIDSFSESNSAVYQTGPLSLVLKDFDSQEDISNYLFNSAQIKLSFAIGEKETDLSVIEEPEQENTTSSEEQTSFWNKIKQFFNYLLTRIRSIVFKALSTAKAEEEPSDDESMEGEAEEEETPPDVGNEESPLYQDTWLDEIVEESEAKEEDPPVEDPPVEEQTPEQELPEDVPLATSTEEVESVEEEPFEEIPEEPSEEQPPETESLPTDQTTSTETEATTTQEELPPVEETTTSSDEVSATSSDEVSEEVLPEPEPEPDPDTLPNLDAKIIIYWSLDGEDWQILDTISSYPLSNHLNNGYFTYNTPFLTDWQDITNLQIKFEGVIGGQTNIISYLDSVWITAEYEEQEPPAPDDEGQAPPTEEEQPTDEGGGGGGEDDESPLDQDTWLDKIVEEPEEEEQPPEEEEQSPEESEETEETPVPDDEGQALTEEEEEPDESEEQPSDAEAMEGEAEEETEEQPEEEQKPTKKLPKFKIKDNSLIFKGLNKKDFTSNEEPFFIISTPDLTVEELLNTDKAERIQDKEDLESLSTTTISTSTDKLATTTQEIEEKLSTTTTQTTTTEEIEESVEEEEEQEVVEEIIEEEIVTTTTEPIVEQTTTTEAITTEEEQSSDDESAEGEAHPSPEASEGEAEKLSLLERIKLFFQNIILALKQGLNKIVSIIIRIVKLQIPAVKAQIEQATTTNNTLRVTIFDPQGKQSSLSPQITTIFVENKEQFELKIERPETGFKPGLWKIQIELETPEAIFISEQEFTWGVLAINVNKSIYVLEADSRGSTRGNNAETAYIQMAVLKDDGHTICDANLELRINNEESTINNQESRKETVLSTEDGTIQYSGECGPNNVTDVPDYYLYYNVEKTGTYEMTLKNLDTGYEITDSFEARPSVPFDVERIGPTRIWPWAPYKMSLKVKANQDFEGEIIETVPASFEISNQEVKIKNNGVTTVSNSSFIIQDQSTSSEKILVWENITLTQGELLEISYTFDAPDVSPYLFLLGPLTIKQLSNAIFSEARQWQLASDFDTGYNDPSAFENDSGWINIPGMYTLGGSDATCPSDTNCETILYNFDIQDLTGVTITGIEAGFRAHDGVAEAVAISLLWNGRSSETLSRQPTKLLATYSYYNYGDSTYLWGEASWDPADFTNANFGVKIADGGIHLGVLYVDHVRVKVFYTVPNYLTQRAYIFENDDGNTVNDNSNMEAVSTITTDVKKGQRLVSRFQIDNTGTDTATTTYKLQYDKQDEQWIDVDFGGAPNINTGASSSDWNATVVNSGGGIGRSSSIAIGSDGNPVIAYYDTNKDWLNVLKCGNPSCTAGNTSSAGVDTSADFFAGSRTSIAIGTDGFPVISYFDNSDVATKKELKFVKCSDLSCTSKSATDIDDDSDSTVGISNSIAIGTDGFPMIAYSGYSDLNFTRCTDGSCTSPGDWSTTTVDEVGSVGSDTSIAIGTDGYPVISYYDNTLDNLNFAKCTTNDCTQKTDWATTTVDEVGNVGRHTSIAIGTDGYPVISYWDSDLDNLNFAKCTSVNCTQKSDWSTTTVDAEGYVGRWTSIAIGTDGNPVISYYDGTNESLKVAKCRDSYCSSVATSSNIIISVDSVGASTTLILEQSLTALTIGNDGWPVISYYRDSDALKVAKMRPLVELQPAWGLSGTSSTPLTSNEAGSCAGGTNWIDGQWYEATTTSRAIPLDTDECTELAFVLDTVEATASTTYRLRLVKEDGTTLDNYVNYPTLKIVSSTANTLRYSKEAIMTSASSCDVSDWNCSTTDSVSDMSGNPSIAIGTDGNPVIAYVKYLGWKDLKVLKCGNPSCTSGNILTTVESSVLVGPFSSIAIGTDGYPVISYYDETNDDLKVLKCGNSSCSSGNISSTIDSYTGGSTYNSIAIGTDGLPVIAYRESAGADLNFAKCGNSSCSSGNSTTTVDSTGDVGWYLSLVIGTDGYPVISFYDNTDDNLNFAKCTTADCTNKSNWSTTTPNSTGDVGRYTSIAIGTDGYPVISYSSFSTYYDLKVAKCGNLSCTSGNTITSVLSLCGLNTSIAIGTDGNPVISCYYANSDFNDYRLSVVKCSNSSCSSGNTNTTIESNTTALIAKNSIGIGSDGYPVIAYFDSVNSDFKIAKQLGLPKTAISYFNRYIKTDGQIKLTRFQWTNGTTGAMFLEASPAMEDGLQYKLDKAGYTAVGANDASYDNLTSAAGTSTSTPVFVFADKHSTNTNSLYARWVGQSTLGADSKNIKLQVFKWADAPPDPGISYTCSGGTASCLGICVDDPACMFQAACSNSSCQSLNNASVSSDSCTNQSFSGSCYCCFTGNNLITMADGSYKNIKDIKSGDEVLAFDEENNILVTDIVKEAYSHPGETDYLLINDTIEVTPNHPVYTPFGWQPAGDLKEGDQLMGDNGELFTIYSTKMVDERVPTYNLDAEKYENFFANGMLAHNKVPGICEASGGISCTGDTGSCDYACDSGYYNCDGDDSNGCESSSPCVYESSNPRWVTVTTESSCPADQDCTIDGSTTTDLVAFYHPEYKFNDSTGTTSADYWTFWRVYQEEVTGGLSAPTLKTDQWQIGYSPFSTVFIKQYHVRWRNDDGGE